jgi:hypothetical protein
MALPAAKANGAPEAARIAASSVFCTVVPNVRRPTKKKSAAASESQALRFVRCLLVSSLACVHGF